MPEGQTQPPMVGVVAAFVQTPQHLLPHQCRPAGVVHFPRERGIGIGQVERLANKRHLIETFGQWAA